MMSAKDLDVSLGSHPYFFGRLTTTPHASGAIPSDEPIYGFEEYQMTSFGWQIVSGGIHYIATNIMEQDDTHLITDSEIDDYTIIVQIFWQWFDNGGTLQKQFYFRLDPTRFTIAPCTETKITTGSGYSSSRFCVKNASHTVLQQSDLLYKFPSTLSGEKIKGFFINHIQSPLATSKMYLTWVLSSGDTFPYTMELTGDIYLKLITSDYDPGTVTWGTKPSMVTIDSLELKKTVTVSNYISSNRDYEIDPTYTYNITTIDSQGLGSASVDYYGWALTFDINVSGVTVKSGTVYELSFLGWPPGETPQVLYDQGEDIKAVP
jgi:hypothetical protein